MASLKELRNRITSVTSTRKITSAMKMVSAAKLKRAQDAIYRMRPYSSKLNTMVSNLTMDSMVFSELALAKVSVPRNVTLVIYSANGSLCGAFNSNILKLAEATMDEYRNAYPEVTFSLLVFGKRGYEYFIKRNFHASGPYKSLVDKPNLDVLSALTSGLIQSFISDHTQRVEIIYNEFVSAGVQRPKREVILPFSKTKSESQYELGYIFEPSVELLLEKIVPKSLKIKMYSALLESVAAEQGARTTAMHVATENASDLIGTLSLQYNKARQSAITNEILEITTGAEAQKSK
ncbi:ATP synthase F1 subunit gamma [Williamwhitmania taraxaci]|uniref:ATP synthase gamma chain n=1 Tax=Williamwhitmania taraxaci TaxID=1640674 RepID=A0A1G6GYH0_9BACT|nr:ATP synthase F1 subunit gamma [Williamwhitmania taraxaci]SDB87100.1 F-type H+-transporting ATPase subunit gamma [Williamwhitmania taraxaci]